MTWGVVSFAVAVVFLGLIVYGGFMSQAAPPRYQPPGVRRRRVELVPPPVSHVDVAPTVPAHRVAELFAPATRPVLFDWAGEPDRRRQVGRPGVEIDVTVARYLLEHAKRTTPYASEQIAHLEAVDHLISRINGGAPNPGGTP